MGKILEEINNGTAWALASKKYIKWNEDIWPQTANYKTNNEP